MNSSCVRDIVLASSCLLTACAAPERIAITDDAMPGAVDFKTYVVRVVDDLTGAPVVGAEVFLVPEAKTPMAGEFWFAHRGRSDADGFVRIANANAPHWHWAILHHATSGAAATENGVRQIWRLGRTFDVPVRVLDAQGNAAPGAHLGIGAGCGHAPDLVTAVADAEGLAVLHGVDPQSDMRDLYVQHPGLQLGEEELQWRPGEPPQEVRIPTGPVLRGRVVDAAGQPVAGAHVCVGARHRGPWGRTGVDGAFEVLGGEIDDYPHRVVTADGYTAHFPRPARTPVTLHLPELGASSEHGHGSIDVPRFVAAEPGNAGPRPTRAVRLRLLQAPSPAIAWSTTGAFWRRLPSPEARMELPAAGPVEIQLLDVSREDADSDAWFAARRYAFADAAALPDPLELTWQASVQVVARAVDERGQPVPVRARLRADFAPTPPSSADTATWTWFPDGQVVLPCDRAGLVFAEIEPQDEVVRGRRWFVNVPARGGATHVRLGDVVVGGPPQFVLRDAAGKRLRAAVVGWQRPGFQQAGNTSDWPLGPAGEWNGPDLQAGDVLVVPGDAVRVPCRFELTGEGPWEFTLPDGQLDLVITDARGRALDATVTFLDLCDDARGGVLALRGLPLGRLRLFVGALGHRSAVVDVDVNTTARTVRIELPQSS